MRSVSNNISYISTHKLIVTDLKSQYLILIALWKRLGNCNYNPQLLEEFDIATQKLIESCLSPELVEIHQLGNELLQIIRNIKNQGRISPRLITDCKKHLLNIKDQLENKLQHIHQGEDRLKNDDGSSAPSTEDTTASATNISTIQSGETESNSDDNNKEIAIALLKMDDANEDTVDSYLSEEHYLVTEFEDVASFEEAIASNEFDLLLIDYHQSSSESIKPLSIEELLANNKHHIPCIMLAEKSDLSMRLLALRAGVHAYLTKPVDSSELLSKISKIQKQRKKDQVKVLIVDDDINLTEFYDATLSELGFEVKCINQPLETLELIEEFHPEALILDYHMPECSGLEIAKILRGDPRHANLPILFLSASEEASQKKGVIDIFGNSFLKKPVESEKLSEILSSMVAKAKQASKHVKNISIRQSEHHLKNRDYFLNELENILYDDKFKQDNTQKYYLAQIRLKDSTDNDENNPILDNHFLIEKYFCTHPLVLGQGCKMQDNCYLILLADRDNIDPQELIEKFRVETCRDLSIDRNQVQLTILPIGKNTNASLVVALQQINSEESKNELLSWIDQEDDNNESGNEINPVENNNEKIKKAIEQNSFQLAYQPIIKPESNEHIFEVLVRLIDEDKEVHLPHHFLPIANEIKEDNYYDMDRWVIQNAFHALENSKSTAYFSIVIKLWPDLKQIERLLPFIYNMVTNSHFRSSSHKVYFCTSTQALLDDLPKAKRIVDSLHRAGCGLMLDHWQGNEDDIEKIASLKHIEFIKFDPEIQSALPNPQKMKQAVKQLTSTMDNKIKVVATLVEDAKTFAEFWNMDIRYFQGYFIHRPSSSMKQKSPGFETLSLDR